MQTKNQLLPKDSQLVFITDETGIFDTFEQLKGQLSQLTAPFITLIYAINESDDDHFPFLRELIFWKKDFRIKSSYTNYIPTRLHSMIVVSFRNF